MEDVHLREEHLDEKVVFSLHDKEPVKPEQLQTLEEETQKDLLLSADIKL